MQSTPEFLGRGRCAQVLALATGIGLYAGDSGAGIILTDTIRSIDARASLSYIDLPIGGFCIIGSTCPPPTTIFDDPPAKTSLLDGDWSESIDASVHHLFETHSSSAWQQSSIALSGDALNVSGSGAVQVDVGSSASSRIRIDFLTDGLYSYSSGVGGAFSAGGDFGPNGSGILSAGHHSWVLSFTDGVDPSGSFFSSQNPTEYAFSLQLQPYTAPPGPDGPPSAIPEPATWGLLASCLAGLAARHRVG